MIIILATSARDRQPPLDYLVHHRGAVNGQWNTLCISSRYNMCDRRRRKWRDMCSIELIWCSLRYRLTLLTRVRRIIFLRKNDSFTNCYRDLLSQNAVYTPVQSSFFLSHPRPQIFKLIEVFYIDNNIENRRKRRIVGNLRCLLFNF